MTIVVSVVLEQFYLHTVSAPNIPEGLVPTLGQKQSQSSKRPASQTTTIDTRRTWCWYKVQSCQGESISRPGGHNTLIRVKLEDPDIKLQTDCGTRPCAKNLTWRNCVCSFCIFILLSMQSCGEKNLWEKIKPLLTHLMTEGSPQMAQLIFYVPTGELKSS